MKRFFEIPMPGQGDRLLFIRFSSLGDVLLALKKAKALKTRFPGMHLTWLTQVEYEGILRMQPYVDDVLTWDIARGRFTVFPLISLVRKGKYQFLYSVHFNDRSALVSAFSGIPHRVGYHKNLRFAYDYPLGVARETWKLADTGEEEVLIRVSEKQKRSLLEKVQGNEGRFLFCAIGASKGFKRWPARSWSKFLSEVAGMGLKPVLVGNGVEEAVMAREIASSCPFDVVDLVGKLSLEEVCALATLSACAVGGDTGPIHLARMAGIPCIGLFAVRDPSRYGHKGSNIVPLVSDSPYETYPERVPGSCPLASIQPERVLREMKKIVASR